MIWLARLGYFVPHLFLFRPRLGLNHTSIQPSSTWRLLWSALSLLETNMFAKKGLCLTAVLGTLAAVGAALAALFADEAAAQNSEAGA